MAGRPPKPTALKLLTGNPGRRPLPENEPVPPPGEAEPPEWLSVGARKMWDRYAPRFKAMRTLTKADEAAFATWMVLLSQVADSETAGVRMSGELAAKVLAFATAFGGTGSGRARIVLPKEDDAGKLGKFRGGKA